MSSALFSFMHGAPACFNPGHEQRHWKENIFLENNTKVYCFSATVGLASMLQIHKASPTVSGLCVEIRTF